MKQRRLFVWFRVAREHEAAAVAALRELHGRWSAQGLQCELLRRADERSGEVTLMEVYRHAGGVGAAWQALIEREAASAAPGCTRHVEVFEPCA